MINGKPYSLPYMEPVTDITAEKFADACFAKGEGWHCMTAAEWGLLACLSWKNGTLPHGNTNCGKYHADPTECGVNVKDSNKTLTGSGPATWTHDHTPTGVHDLCGNVLEIVRGLRIKDGALWAAENNDAALPETDLTTCGDGWKPIVDSNGDQVYVDAMDGIKFTNEKPQHGRANFESWEDVRIRGVGQIQRGNRQTAGRLHQDAISGLPIFIHGNVLYSASESGRQLEQWRQRWPVQLEPQQSAQQFQLEHRGPFRFTPRHIMCGDTTLDMGAVIYGS